MILLNLTPYPLRTARNLFYDNDPASGVLIGEDVINVSKGSSEKAEALWNATPGQHDIYVWISPYNSFLELNYSNNMANKSINVSIVNNSCISGTKFNDTNFNGTRDPGEAGLLGWTIRLTRPDGTTINATTDASGTYRFENLTSGTYRVSEICQSNWTQTYPAWLGDHIINISDGNVTGVDFGNSYLPVPNIPFSPAGPASGIPGIEYSYSTSSTDSNGYQISYTFDWGDGANSTTGLFDSGAIASAAHIWNNPGIYQVRAMATDNKGASSEWSDSLAVSINALSSSTLYYPDFTDTADPNSWRSWLVLQNPNEAATNVTLSIRSRSGDMLYAGDTMISPYGVSAIRPRNLAGADCAGSVIVSSDQPLTGTCQITRNSNEMCMGYNALDGGSTVLYYPDFTDTATPDGWRSWLVLQNPAASPANLDIEIRSRAGDILYSGEQIIPAHGVNAIRPRNLAGSDCAGSVFIESDLPVIGTCQITRNSNKMCMSYTASDHGSTTLYYPDFTDTANPDGWRSWLVLQNPSDAPANLNYEIRSRAGDLLYTGSDIIPAHGVNAIRPRNLAGADCAGSVVVTSDQPIVGTCQITRNSNEMCMSYNALDRGSTVLNYPDFTDTANPDGWRSWLVLQNPAAADASITLEISSREGDLLYRGDQIIPAHGVNAIRPRSLVGSDCSGSVVVTSDQQIVGTCQITRNNNLMCMSYTAIAQNDKGGKAWI
jgi:hypothetical protein